MHTEGLTIEFLPDGVAKLADIAFSVNERVENIGARRLYTVLEKLLEELAFEASKLSGQTIKIDAAYVEKRLGELAKHEDITRYVL
jgi:ATP-dependent HslUV protease ATP-binding subunit HslU